MHELIKKTRPYFIRIINKINTEGALIDIREELSQIGFVFDPFIDTSNGELKPYTNEELKQYIKFYQKIKKTPSEELKNLEEEDQRLFSEFDIFSEANKPELINDLVNGSTGTAFEVFARQMKRSFDKKFKRIDLGGVVVSLTSYGIGWVGSSFYMETSRDGAKFMPLAFMRDEEFAMYSGFGLNAFLNGFFFCYFITQVLDAGAPLIVFLIESVGLDKCVKFARDFVEEYLKDKKENTLDLNFLRDLDTSRKAMFLRGFKTFLTVSFYVGASSAATYPFVSVDLAQNSKFFRALMVALNVFGLNVNSSQGLLRVIVKAGGIFPAAYRQIVYTEQDWKKYHTLKTAERVLANFKKVVASGFDYAINNKAQLKSETRTKIYNLAENAKNSPEDAIAFLLAIMQLARAPEKDYFINSCIRYALLTYGLGGMALTLSGYVYDTKDTTHKAIHDEDLADIATGFIVPVFLSIYFRISWDVVGDVYDATIAKVIKFICNRYENSNTGWNAAYNIIVGGLANLGHALKHHLFSVPREKWRRKTDFLDSLEPFLPFIKPLYNFLKALVGVESATTALYLISENLPEEYYAVLTPEFILYNVLIYTAIINTYALGLIEQASWRTASSVTASTEDTKKALVLQDQASGLMKLLDVISPVVLIEILWNITQAIPDGAEKVIQALFAGQSPEQVFGPAEKKEQSLTEMEGGVEEMQRGRDLFTSRINNLYLSSIKEGLFYRRQQSTGAPTTERTHLLAAANTSNGIGGATFH